MAELHGRVFVAVSWRGPDRVMGRVPLYVEGCFTDSKGATIAMGTALEHEPLSVAVLSVNGGGVVELCGSFGAQGEQDGFPGWHAICADWSLSNDIINAAACYREYRSCLGRVK